MSAPASSPPPPVVRVQAGTTAGAAVRAAGLPSNGPSAVVVVRADGALRDLAWAPDVDVDVEPVAADTEDGRSVIRHSAAHVLAQAVQQHAPGRQARHRPADHRRLLLRLRRRAARSPPRISSRSRSAMKQIVKAGQRFSRRRLASVDDARKRARRRAVQAGTGRPQGRRGGRATPPRCVEVGAGELTDLRQRARAHRRARLGRPLPRARTCPPPKYIPAFKLTRSRPPPTGAASEKNAAAAAHLRHRLGVAGGPRRLPGAQSPRPNDATIAGWAPSWTCSASPTRSGPAWRCSTPRAGSSAASSRTTRRLRHIEAGYEFVNTPHITKGRLFETSGHLDWYADGMFPAMHLDAEYRRRRTSVRKPGQDYYLKPMNCPMHNLIFRSRGPVVPGAAAAAVRVRHRLPLREVRGDPRPDPGPRVHPGRRAHLLHPRADAGRDPLAAAVRPRPPARLRARRLLPRAVHPRPGEVDRRRRGLGAGHRHAARGRRRVRSRARARPGRRRVLRAEDHACRPRTRSGAPGRCRPSRSTSCSRTGSAWSTPPPTAPGSDR